MAHKMKREGVDVEIPVTPMLDMAFQILVFFILTYHPSAREFQIDGTLLPPDTTVKAKAQPKGVPPPKEESSKEKPPDTGENLVVLVEAYTAHDIAPQAKDILGGKKDMTDAQFEDWLDWKIKSLTSPRKIPRPASLQDIGSGPTLDAPTQKNLLKLAELLGRPRQITLQLPTPPDDAPKKPEGKEPARKIKVIDIGKNLKAIQDELNEDLKQFLSQHLEDELKQFLKTHMDSPAEDTIVIYVKDVNLQWGYLIRIWDMCKARYGVTMSKGEKDLVKVTKKQEKEFTKIVGFKNVSYLIPAKKVATPAGPPSKIFV